MRAITKIRRSIKAISPVISVLLMIAIAVAASLIAYAWIMGYLGGTTTKTQKAILIQSIAADEDTGNLVVYVQNVGIGAVQFDPDACVYVEDVLKTCTVDGSAEVVTAVEGQTVKMLVGYAVESDVRIKIKAVTLEGVFSEITDSISGTAATVYEIAASAGTGGTIVPSGTVPVSEGDSITFTITANSGWHILDVVVDGVSQSAIDEYTFTDVHEDHTIAASFSQNEYALTITVNPPAGGHVDAVPAGPYHLSDSVQLTAVPNTGYAFSEWSDDLSGSDNPDNVIIDEDPAVTATFTLKTYTITPSAGSGGSISPSTPQTVTYGDDITFTITADGGYHIADVLVDSGSVGAVGSYTFNDVDASHTIAASFAINTYIISASAGAGGSITPSGSVVVTHGASQSFDIAAGPNYHILDVVVDGGSVGAVSSYTFTNVVAGHTISATFQANTHTITASAGAGGSISPSGSVVVNHGADQSFTITADTGYHIVDVLVDSVSQGAISSYTFINVQADHTISATFAEDQPKLVYIDDTVPQTRNVGQMSTVIRVQRQDAAGNPVTSGWTTVNLASSSGDGHFYFWFFDYIPTTSVTIFPGFSYAEFYYRDYTAGTPTLTASDEDGVYTSAVTTFTITVPPPPHYIDTNNVVHDDPNVGSHSSFPNMQNDGSYDTLTEANTGGGAESWISPTGYVSSNWANEGRAYDGDTGTRASFGIWRNSWSDWLTLNYPSTTGTKVRYFVGRADTDINNMQIEVYNTATSSWQSVYSGAPTVDSWVEVTFATKTTNQIRLRFYNDDDAYASRDAYVYEVAIGSVPPANYQLDLEVQFTGVTDFASYTRLEIQTGDFGGSEDLHVYYWNGAAWIRLTDDGGLDEYSLDIFTVSLTSGTFELRFFDEDRSSDTYQTSWEIDYVRLVVP